MINESKDLRPNFTSFLTRQGWSVSKSGSAGETWSIDSGAAQKTFGEAKSRNLAIPYEIEKNSFEYQSIIDRLSRFAAVDKALIAEVINCEFEDSQNYRIADRYVSNETALLEGASTVLSSARKLIRVAATTSRKPRALIGPNYSRPGDEIANKARLAHTKTGSFILPIVMPIQNDTNILGTLEADFSTLEPGERAVTRTLASAINALNSVALKPESFPTSDDLMNLIQTGVSKELVSTIREIIVSAGVSAFDVSFTWAPAITIPKEIPNRIVISEEAAPLLKQVAIELGKTNPESDTSVSGQIVRIHYVQGDPYGSISIRTERRNRVVDVSIIATSEIIHMAYVWARDHRAVIARGLIERKNGKTLSIPEPTAILPIDQLFVDSFPGN